MATINKLKIINDPIYGFISIPNPLLYDIIQHPYFQRLRRINQMGLSNMVYPGATHTRFHHALGCLHLMQKAIQVLKFKRISITEEEELAVYTAILLHDIGHGPFSHAMEQSIVENVNHEQLSLAFMELLNKDFKGKLSLAIKIFKGEYHRDFLFQLISSQLDMDRMDYLKRDSFYSGVSEGSINSERIIQMLNVFNDQLVIEEKGLYSVEKFLVARRLMYWQCYLHKTSVVAESILTKILLRAKELIKSGVGLWSSPALNYFFIQESFSDEITEESLHKFALLDDSDVIITLKNWQFHEDKVLSYLCSCLINRKLLKIIEVNPEKVSLEIDNKVESNSLKGFTIEDIKKYLVFSIKVENTTYSNTKQPIKIKTKHNQIKNLLDYQEIRHLEVLSQPISKTFICYPKINLID